MGAFLLIRKAKDSSAQEIETLYRDSIIVFDKKGLSLRKRLVGDEFLLYVFNKYQLNADNIVVFNNGEFIVATGTCIYGGRTESTALKNLFNDFSDTGEFLSDISGNYCLIVYKKGKLYLLNDYLGLYRVYANKSKSVVSSSFLAVLKTLRTKSISTQEFYEYVINEAFYGEQTLIKEIELIDSRSIWKLWPILATTPKQAPKVRTLDRSSSFSEMVEEVLSNLVDYFAMLKTNFGDSVSSALTGGFDTRLMLALMRKVGIRPYLYIYGDETSPQVKVAKTISNGERLLIEYENHRSGFGKFREDEALQRLEKQYFMFDGLGHERGVFDNGSDLHLRLKRASKARLNLNGGGGEIFRNFWSLPDRKISIESFLASKYDHMDYSICTDHFEKKSYFSAFSNKIRSILNTSEKQIDRRQVEMLYPYLRLKYWMSSNNSINNQFSYALTPFTDMRFVNQSLDIPLKFKDLGLFEAALIKFIDPDLAKYQSVYGFNFFDGIPLNVRMEYFVKLHTPLCLRPWIRKRLWGDHRLSLNRPKVELPFYLTEKYLYEIFGSEDMNVARYINISNISDPRILSRVLTVELVITDRF